MAALSGTRPAFANTMPTLVQSFAGNLNFAGTQRTLRTASNSENACSVSSGSTSTQAAVSGIPSGATVRAAYLYWAGSGGRPDYNVAFEGRPISAAADRRYTANFATASATYSYFSGVANVTSFVASKGEGTGNGVYTFSGLTVDSSSKYCNVEAVLAGWALLVVYSHSSEEFRVLNLYEGFQTFQHNSFTLNLSNFSIPGNFNKGRIAHLSWEGDPTLSGGGENLTFNGFTMGDSTNPAGNQFNSASTIKSAADIASHGIDFDAYDLKAPVIQAGQTSATSTYSSGQDLVLLSAEIVAMPNGAVADLGVSIALNEPLMLGQNASYTIEVVNNGPDTEPGPVTITSDLPAELHFISGGGSGWTCTAVEQKVTCTYSGSDLPSGAFAPALALTVSVSAISNADITTSVTVAGTLFDNISTNNAAAHTARIGASKYVFTDSACARNVAFGPKQPCKLLKWDVQTAAQPLDNIYITLINAAQMPVQVSPDPKTVSMQLALSCHDPKTHAGVRAAVRRTSATAEMLLPLCMSNGAVPTAWSGAVNVPFGGQEPSSGPYTFTYADVGRIAVFLKESATSSGSDASSGPFIVKPKDIALSDIRCTTIDVATCGGGAMAMSVPGNNPAASDENGPAFIRAGHPFTVSVTARNASGNATPNFGREVSQENFVLKTALVSPAGGASPGVAGTFGAISGGKATGSAFTWGEVGIIRIVPGIADGDYLGTGDIPGTEQRVGRFYPHHFEVSGSVSARSDVPVTTTTGSINAGSTTLALASSANIAVGHVLRIEGAGAGGATLTATVISLTGSWAALSTAASTTVSAAVVMKATDTFTYMGEPMRLRLQVTAYNASEAVTENYAGAYAKLGHTTLGTGANWFKATCSGTSACLGIGAVNGATALTDRLAIDGSVPGSAPTSAWIEGVGVFEASVRLNRPATADVATWGPYETIKFGAAPRDSDGVTLPALAADATHGMDLDADIDGIRERREMFTTISRLGRLKIASANGSELLPLPIGVTAQYWNGTSYEANALDNNTSITPANILLSSYQKNLQAGETKVITPPSSIVFVKGVGRFTLAKPGGGDGKYDGSVDMSVNAIDTYLPANRARARFGVYKRQNQIIYSRENY